MNTLDIFLASSNELAPERNYLSYIAVLIDDALCRRGIQLRIQKWEHFDAAMNEERKQTEYNHHLRESQMVVVLFWNKLGKYTREEYDEAASVSGRDASRALSLFFKASADPSAELKAFRQEAEVRSPGLVRPFATEDELALHFLLEVNRYTGQYYGQPFLRKVGEGGNAWLYADDIRLCPIPGDAGRDVARGEDLSETAPQDDGLKPLTMFLACTPDQTPLRNDFCDLLLAWNKMIAARGRKIRLRFFDRSKINDFINNSEIATAFYWRDFGGFDEDALNEARRHLAARENPRKIFLFFRNDDSEILSQDIQRHSFR